MTLSLAVASALARQCAPQVAPSTMVALILNESALDPLAIGDNSTKRSFHPVDRAAAERLASALIGQGHSIDMGIAQINSRTARTIGLKVSDAFDACASIAAAGDLMVSAYRRLAPQAPTEQHALAATLSTYNTGDKLRGFTNGYVSRVYRAAARSAAIAPAPAIVAVNFQDPAQSGGKAPSTGDAAGKGSPPDWAVFGSQPSSTMVFSTAPKGR